MNALAKDRTDLYSGRDPRDLPIYSVAAAARHIKMSPATLRSWVAGRGYRDRSGKRHFSPPIIERPDPEDDRLSFNNLVEAHVLRALRVRHSVPMPAVRGALDYAQREMKIERLLINKALRAAPGELFLERYQRLLSLAPAGQFAMKRVLDSFLERVVHDAEGMPQKLFPFPGPGKAASARAISIDPRIAFGAPVIADKGVRTEFLVDLYNGGESVEDLATFYDLEVSDVEAAILYESAA